MLELKERERVMALISMQATRQAGHEAARGRRTVPFL